MRLLSALLVLCSFGLANAAEPKINTDKLLFHVKETFNLPPGVDMKLGKAEKSEIPGLYKVALTLSKGGQAQDRMLLVSEDGSRYLVAEIQDVNKLPDADVLKQLKTEGAPSKGPATAKVTVVEYTDYQCPYCKRAHEAITDNLFKTYGDKVRLVFKHYPLVSIHPWAEPAGVAGACVAKIKPDAFYPWSKAVFTAQAEITAENAKSMFMKFAAAQKVDAKKIEECYDKKETLELVRKDASDGEAIGVNSTPTLFVNGHRVTGFGGFEQLKALIDEMLAGTHQPASFKN